MTTESSSRKARSWWLLWYQLWSFMVRYTSYFWKSVARYSNWRFRLVSSTHFGFPSVFLFYSKINALVESIFCKETLPRERCFCTKWKNDEFVLQDGQDTDNKKMTTRQQQWQKENDKKTTIQRQQDINSKTTTTRRQQEYSTKITKLRGCPQLWAA